jgi:hypothetical protein
MIRRRRFLTLSAGASAALWAHGCGDTPFTPAPPDASPTPLPGGPSAPPVFVPKVNEPINIHPVRRLGSDPRQGGNDLVIVPELVALQMRAVYEMGFDGIRLTAPLGNRGDVMAAVAYTRAARALGIDAVVVLATFAGLTPAQALWSDTMRPQFLALFNRLFARPPEPAAPGAGGLGPRGVGRIAFQVLNEPSLFFGIPPDVYVQEFLVPTFVELKTLNSQIIVVSAAEVGSSSGPLRIRAMLEAGLEGACDRVAYHIYVPEALERLPPHVRQTVWVTESGTSSTSGHLAWVRDMHPRIKARLEDATRVFYYVLYDSDPGRFRLIDIEPAGGSYRAVVESTELHAYYMQRVRDRAAGRPLIPFDTLIPDITRYFATPDDVAAYDAFELP